VKQTGNRERKKRRKRRNRQIEKRRKRECARERARCYRRSRCRMEKEQAGIEYGMRETESFRKEKRQKEQEPRHRFVLYLSFSERKRLS